MKKFVSLVFFALITASSTFAQPTQTVPLFRCELIGAGTIHSIAESNRIEWFCLDAGEVPDPVCEWRYIYNLSETAKTPTSPRLSLQHLDEIWRQRRVGIKVSKSVSDFLATRPTLKRAVVPSLEPYFEVKDSGLERPVAVFIVASGKLVVQEATLKCTVGP